MPDDLPVFDTSEADAALPSWDETPAPIDREKRKLRAEAALGKAEEFVADLGQRAAYTVSQMRPDIALSRLVELPYEIDRALGLVPKESPNPLAQPVVSPEQVRKAAEFVAPDVATIGQFGREAVSQFARPGVQLPVTAPPEGEIAKAIEGAKQFGAEFASGLTTPANVAAMVAAPTYPEAIGRTFQTAMIAEAPQAIQNAIEAAKSGDTTQAVKAGLGAATTVGLPLAIERGLAVKPQLKPAIKTMDGEVIEGKAGETHNDIIAENKLKPEDIDRREFTDQQGNELSREQAAAARPDIKPEVVPATAEKPAELHSTDLPEAKAKEAPVEQSDYEKAFRQSLASVESSNKELLKSNPAGFIQEEITRLERKKSILQELESLPRTLADIKTLTRGQVEQLWHDGKITDNLFYEYAKEWNKTPRFGDKMREGPLPAEEPQTKMPPPSTEAPSQRPETPAAAPVSEAKAAEAAPSATPPAIAQGDIGQGKAQVEEVIPAKTKPATELPRLRKADVKSDPRLEMPGITKRSKPNSLIVAIRDLESVPIKDIVLKSSGDPMTDAKTVESTIRNYVRETGQGSIRESLAVTTGKNGRAIYKFGISPNGMTWTEARQWLDLVEGKKKQPDALSKDLERAKEGLQSKLPGALDYGYSVGLADELMRGEWPVGSGYFNYWIKHTDELKRAAYAIQRFIGTKFEREGDKARVAALNDFISKNIDVESVAPEQKLLPPGPGAQTAGEPPYSPIGQLTDRIKATEPVGTKETVSMRDRITESWAKGKTIAQRALASARSLSESLKDTARGIRKITDVDRRLGTLDWELQESSARSIAAGKAMRDQVKNKTDREAVAIWIDSGGDEALIRSAVDNLPKDTRPSIRAAVTRAANLTPELKQFAQDLKQFYGLREQDAISHEIFEHGLEDYFTHIWEREANMPDSVRAAVNGGKVNDYFRFARQRKISMFLEGILNGKVPNLDPADVISLYNYSLDRAIASRKFIRDLADVTASDGRPVILPTGTAARVMEEGTPKALIINPKGKAAEGMDYRTIDHPALRKWKWAGTDENGNPVLYRSDLAVHPEFYERLSRIMDRGRLSPSTWGRRLLRASTEVKGFKLGVLSMFHQVHVGSHALWHWTQPFKVAEINWDAPETRFAIEKGHLKVAPDPRQMTEFAEGIMPQGLVGKIPFLGPWSKAYSEWTFQSYIPRLKMATFDNAYKRALWMREKGLGFKNLTDEQIAARTGDSVNNAFGELNQWFLGKHGRAPEFQRLLRGIFLAPDFGEARLRFAEKTLTRYGHEERLAMATMLLTMYIGARIANRLTHGDPEWDEKHAFDVKVGEHWWSMRSVAGDINHAVNDFGNFMYVRLNPLYARTASDWLFGRDPRGKKLTLSEKALKRPVEQLVPIQFGALTRDDQKLWESFVTALGVQTRRDRPDQDVYQLARDWMKASKDPKLLERAAALEQSVFPSSPYAKLRYALQNDDTLAATKAIKELRANKHTDRQIREAFDPTKPFTGTHKSEPAFKNSLTDAQKQLYNEAMKKRWQIQRRLVKAMSIPPTDVPQPDTELPTWDNTSSL